MRTGRVVPRGHAFEERFIRDPVRFVPVAIGIEDERSASVGVVGSNGRHVADRPLRIAREDVLPEVGDDDVSSGSLVIHQHTAEPLEGIGPRVLAVHDFYAKSVQAVPVQGLAQQVPKFV
jgi:hypothetical protein